MIQPPSIKDLIQKVTFIMLPFVLFGFAIGHVYKVIIIGLVALLIWHHYYLLKSIKWLTYDSNAAPDKAKGVWEQVFDGLYQLQRKHKKKRKELGQLIKRFRKGAESLPDSVVIFTSDRSIVWCNSLAQVMMGFKMPNDIGNRLDNFLRQPEFIHYLEKKQYDDPFEFSSPVHEHIILECRIAPFEKNQWTLIARDVTQLRLMEQMRKDFIANVSHELRTPLTVMRGYLEMLPDNEPPSMGIWPQAHKMMSEQSFRMEALVEQLMTLTRLENTVPMEYSTPVNVPELLAQIKSDAEALSNGQHTITLNLDTELWLLSDKEQLRSAISNLVFNAVKYTPERGNIALTWKRLDSGAAYFSCKDDGLGIAQEHIARLTERFYRIDEARARDTGGSGLGLSIVNRILKNHESELNVTSLRLAGSTFSFEIDKKFTHKAPEPVAPTS